MPTCRLHAHADRTDLEHGTMPFRTRQHRHPVDTGRRNDVAGGTSAGGARLRRCAGRGDRGAARLALVGAQG